MSVAGLEAIQWENPLANELVVVIVHGYSQDCQVREDYLRAKNGIFTELWKAAPKNHDLRNLDPSTLLSNTPLRLKKAPDQYASLKHLHKLQCPSHGGSTCSGFLEIISSKVLDE